MTFEPESADDDSESGPSGIGKDDAFHVLQNTRRRAVLRYLLDCPDCEQFRMRDLAEEVAAWEHDTTVRQLSSDQRQRVYIALYQSHLPTLDDTGIIRYNQSRGIVEPTELLAVFGPYLEEGLHAETQRLTTEGPSGYEVDQGTADGAAVGTAEGTPKGTAEGVAPGGAAESVAGGTPRVRRAAGPGAGHAAGETPESSEGDATNPLAAAFSTLFAR